MGRGTGKRPGVTRIVWEGIPETYWPDTEKPWRVSWGIGAFEDFATKAEAQQHADKLRKEWAGKDWADSVRNPFNATKIRTTTKGEK